MSDPIAPPAARWPSEAAELVALAVSDGDLGAALAQYEMTAAFVPWAEDQSADQPAVRDTMSAIMQLRLPLNTRLVALLPADGLAMLVYERSIEGTGPDGAEVRLHGVGCTVVRPQQDGSWRIAADAWCLSKQPNLSPPGPVGVAIPPEFPSFPRCAAASLIPEHSAVGQRSPAGDRP
jgi:ketosteroid isomerase-like protein